MFRIDPTTQTIHLTRGDIAKITVTALRSDGRYHEFSKGDIVRFQVFKKKEPDAVVLSKSITVLEPGPSAVIQLTSKETRFVDSISKPVDHWYEIELNPDSNPQTLIGYDENGAKIFRLYPESGKYDIVFQNLTITENGTYTADNGYAAIETVEVNVQPKLQDKTITENGTYTADEGYTGLGEVEVSVIDKSAENFIAYTSNTLTELELPYGATSIRPYMFYQESKLTKIIIPDTVTSIGSGAFGSCQIWEKYGKEAVQFHDGIKSFGSAVFQFASMYTGEFVFPKATTYIGTQCFSQTKNITSFIIQENIKTIGTMAFIGCPHLLTVTIKGTPTSIGGSAFSSNSNLKTLNVAWAEGEVSGAPWGATNATINYNYTGE